MTRKRGRPVELDGGGAYVAFRMSKRDLARLDTFRARYKVTRSRAVQNILRQYLDKLELREVGRPLDSFTDAELVKLEPSKD